MIYFIINPNAGTNKQSNYHAFVQLIKANPGHFVLETTQPLEAIELTQKAIASGASRIIAVGGDGTINEVASALVGSQIPMGIVPIGSGNGLARHLGIPLDPINALDFAIRQPAQKMDVGYFNNRPFFCTAGIGFDASVAHRFAKGSKRGFINYIKATFQTLFTYEPIKVSINGGNYEHVFSLTIANANQFGNNAFISPFSNTQDGLLELIKINRINIFQAAIIGIRLFWGNINKARSVQISSIEKVTIRYQTNAPFHLDGEQLFTPESEIQIKIQPLAIQVVF